MARRPWWGGGDPPHVRWPGVSLTFDAVWSSARRRWETDEGRYYFDWDAAERAVEFFPLYLKHHIGEFAGQPFVLRDDQDLLMTRPLFGWKRTADGLRRFTKFFGFCPKGYGKSGWASGVGLYMVRCDHEPAAEGVAVAADREQARIVHDGAKAMVESCPDLAEGAEILKDTIVWADRRCTYKVVSSDAAGKHGGRPHVVIFDELHAIDDRDLFEAFAKSMAKRRQPLLLIITHAGVDDESVAFEEYDLAKRILQGQTTIQTTLPVVFEMQKGDDWTDPAVWQRVNPAHGTLIQHDAIVSECAEAQAAPRKKNDFERFHLNKWTNQATAWIAIEEWDACRGLVEDAELVTLDCAAGLDLAQKWDLAAFVVTFRRYLSTPVESVEVVAEEPTGGGVVKKTIDLNYELIVRPFFWIPENTMKKHAKLDGVPYDVWAAEGLVTPTEGDIIDYSRIYLDITTKILPRYPRLKEATIGYDPAFATDIATKLRDLAGLQIVEILQNYKHLSEPSQIIEALIKGKRVRHDGHRVLRWNVENVAVKTDDAGRIRPVKPKHAAKRIDGVIGMIMGDRALSLSPPRPQPKYQVLIVGGAHA